MPNTTSKYTRLLKFFCDDFYEIGFDKETVMNAISVNQLTKVYPSGKEALCKVDFSISPGEVFGFLGPNGAGKTTTVKLLTGTLSPTSGSCSLFGIDPTEKPAETHKFSGVVTEHAQMYDHLTGLENLIFYGTVFGANQTDARQRALSLLTELELKDAMNRELSAYSTGMRQRLSLARALIHSPKILFLDEPTSGLDPESVLQVNSTIERLAREQGVTVFLCTHQLRYAQEICSCYGLLDQGLLLAKGNLDSLRNLVFSGRTVTVRTDKMPQNLGAVSGGDHSYSLQVRQESEIPQIVRSIVEAGGNVFSVVSRQLSLEEIYFALTTKAKEETI